MDLLERIEEPEALLKQAFREMEEDLCETVQRFERLTLEREQMTARVEEIDTKLADLGGELDLCLESGNDELARSLIRRKLESRRLMEHFSAKLRDTEKTIDGLTRKIKELESGEVKSTAQTQ